MLTYAAFQELAQECRAAGLASEYAIHSCLKHWQHPALAFLHAPYVVLAGGPKSRTPNLPIVEELIRRAGGPIHYDVLSRPSAAAWDEEIPIQGDRKQTGNVIRTQKGFCTSSISMPAQRLFGALKHVERKLAGEGPLSANAIYAEKKRSCRQLRIDGPRMLHSVLLRYGAGYSPRTAILFWPRGRQETVPSRNRRNAKSSADLATKAYHACCSLNQSLILEQLAMPSAQESRRACPLANPLQHVLADRLVVNRYLSTADLSLEFRVRLNLCVAIVDKRVLGHERVISVL